MGFYMQNFPRLNIAVYSDGANKRQIIEDYREGFVEGFTTNPTLMAKAGLNDYKGFAKSVLLEVTKLPISFEVFSDEFDQMEKQALEIASWGENVNVKIPIMNTKGESSIPLIQKLLERGVKLNVTAVFTKVQLEEIRKVVGPKDDVIVSVFAGRIADTGVDPVPTMNYAVDLFSSLDKIKVLWASPREVLNIYQAEACGCDIITVTPDLIKKLKFRNHDLNQFSLETVEMFYKDAVNAGFQIDV